MSDTIPFNDTSRIYRAHREPLMDSMRSVAESGWWLLGGFTKTFSEAFAAYCGTDYCLPVANGTDALELALRGVLGERGEDSGGEVITVANAGGYTTTACRIVGAIPVYADIDEGSQLLSMQSLENCIGPKLKAVVVTHLYGGVVDVLQVRKVLERCGAGGTPIIEDCAQAHGGCIGEHRVGSLGDVATFSFYPTKNLGAMGDGGAVLTSDLATYTNLKALHQYGWDEKYRVVTPFGRNSRMDEMQAAVLSNLLPYLDDYNQKRRELYAAYRQAAGAGLQFLKFPGTDFVGHLAVVLSDQRDDFVAYMRRQNISVDIHYPILDCDQPGWIGLPMRTDQENGLAASRRSIGRIVSLPCFPLMTEAEVSRVCVALAKWGGSLS